MHHWCPIWPKSWKRWEELQPGINQCAGLSVHVWVPTFHEELTDVWNEGCVMLCVINNHSAAASRCFLSRRGADFCRQAPFSVRRSTSTVGFPRESKISLATMLTIDILRDTEWREAVIASSCSLWACAAGCFLHWWSNQAERKSGRRRSHGCTNTHTTHSYLDTLTTTWNWLTLCFSTLVHRPPMSHPAASVFLCVCRKLVQCWAIPAESFWTWTQLAGRRPHCCTECFLLTKGNTTRGFVGMFSVWD